ncbi:N-dimethylarginine dimethylaminohydrolase [Dysgonomonas sp. PH5-45]|uniref:dimethylarginine dimethylaminohydrolase family protein n=1 Tax=unclassified Dysgonomonas TaxID=2630389 RepID=UPI00247545E9|nr:MULTISPECIES: arginine deiminase family protein [unclassified Dysgonomonas]MDH6356050.1 N-dimethylarginine dimethylaminohydrolase [Dysgonomonas sp. PH5-45]MDH6388944.1 N-dimethylarginine dimethylaminohydrolase [Dysgonomonas sp. PH5-37]
MLLNVQNETSPLKTVVIGRPNSNGADPKLEETYDAKSYEQVKNGTYPKEEDIVTEMTALEQALKKHGVEVLKPDLIENCNQVFARDVAFVIDDKIIKASMISDRVAEQAAYNPIYEGIDPAKKIQLPEGARVEGGDVVLYNETIFVGTYTGMDFSNYKTARTNIQAVLALKELFPKKNIIPLELVKNDFDPRKGILHLDCTFMPVGNDKAIIYKNGFTSIDSYQLLVDFFGKDNVFEITNEEMYYMNSNIFSISPTVVVSEERFTRLNRHLTEEWGITVEAIPYHEISKMGGLLRCSTQPLVRG